MSEKTIGSQVNSEIEEHRAIKSPCMTLHEYACIHLKVPKITNVFLNETIIESLRNDFAGQAMHEILIQGGWGTYDKLAEEAYQVADSMIKEMGK